MEREKCTHLYSRRSDFRQDFSQLEDLDNKSTGERKAERKFFIQNMDGCFRDYTCIEVEKSASLSQINPFTLNGLAYPYQ